MFCILTVRLTVSCPCSTSVFSEDELKIAGTGELIERGNTVVAWERPACIFSEHT